jgi:hypothetical protein
MSKGDQRSPISLPTALTESSIGCGVAIDSNGNAVLPTAGGAIVGVMYGLSGTSSAATIRTPCDGAVLAQYGGTVTLPATLKVNASGQFVTASAGDLAAGAGVAVALDAGSSGELHAVILIGGASAQASVTGDETVTSGALSNTATTSYLSVTGTKAYTLPDGLFDGQRHRVECSVAASTPIGTLTITTPQSGEQATYTFDTVLQAVTLEWKHAGGTAGWHCIGKARAGSKTFVVGTSNIGGDDLHLQNDLSVTGTVSSSLADGNVPGERIHITTSTAASTPLGSITGHFKTKVGVASATWGSGTLINATTAYLWAEWDGAKWHEIVSATALFA